MKLPRGLGVLLLFPSTFLALYAVAAQQRASLRPGVFAVRNARVVTEPGKTLSVAHVVIRDGLVTDVGPQAAIPPDALIVEGAGLTVYPGFIDAMNHRGFDVGQRRVEIMRPTSDELANEALALTRADYRKGV